jgi:hypothetical protein
MSDTFGYNYLASGGGSLGWGGNSNFKTCKRGYVKKRKPSRPLRKSEALLNKLDKDYGDSHPY